MAERPRIVLGEEDFAPDNPTSPAGDASPQTSFTTARIGEVQTGSLPTITRGAPLQVDPQASLPGTGAAATPRPSQTIVGSWLSTPSKTALVTAASGVLLAWIVTEILGITSIHGTTKTGSDAISGLWTGVVGVMFGGTLIAFDSALAGAWDVAAKRFARAALPMLGVAFIAGFAGNAIYLQIVQSAIEAALRGATTLTDNDVRFYLARGLGWALFGAGIGTTIGFLVSSRQRAINGALGGAAGGAAGGVLFQFVGANLGSSDSMSRLVGLIGVGGLIALATRAVETARREAWLEVLAGGMAGKEFILYHSSTRIGASPDCEIFLLKDPSIAKVHAQIDDREGQRILTATSDAPVFVNHTAVATQVLRNGDQVQLGHTVIGYSERALAAAPAAGP
jgi:hypothetical protein